MARRPEAFTVSPARYNAPPRGSVIVIDDFKYRVMGWDLRRDSSMMPKRMTLELEAWEPKRFALLSNGLEIELRDSERNVKVGDSIAPSPDSRVAFRIETIRER